MIDRKKIREYFAGKSQIVPLVLLIIGILTIAIIIGVFFLIAALVVYLINKFGVDASGQAEADKAREYEINLAKERAFAKLNIIGEQVNEVDPVVVSGRGFEPQSPTSIAVSSGSGQLLKRSLVRKTDDPIYMTRIGTDDVLRCSLLKVTVFMFGEKQLYIYYSNVDITTGLVYSEGTYECFYSDINALEFQQDREKIFNYRTKQFERRLFESVKLFASGCHYTASLSTKMDHSIVDEQFTGMRNLIREKKNS